MTGPPQRHDPATLRPESLTACELGGDYAAWWERRPTRFRSVEEAEEWCYGVAWRRDLSEWPEWTQTHLTEAQTGGDHALPFKAVYAILVDRSGLPGPTRAVLHYLARRCDREGARHRRCWPPIDTICDRTGFGRTAVKAALRTAEQAGWVLVVRHTKRPSDYVLDVPDLFTCPCAECHPCGSGDDRQGSGDDRQTVGRRPPVGREATTHLGSALGFSHLGSITCIAADADDARGTLPADLQEHRQRQEQGCADHEGKTPGEVAQELGERWAMQGRHPSDLEAALARELGQHPDAVPPIVLDLCRQAHRKARLRRVRVAS